MKTMILHYKLLTDGAVERSLLPQGHEAQLQSLLSSLIGAPAVPSAPASHAGHVGASAAA